MTDYQIINGDCREAARDIEPVDAVVCDPPYGLSFMGKGWDHSVPGPDYWTAIMDAAKPGAHLLAFGGTRCYHRLTCAIEDAGWEVRDCLMWLYGSGFPKSHNLKDAWKGWGTALKPAWEPIILARKPFRDTVAGNVTEHGTGALNIDGCRVGTSKQVPSGLSHNKSNITYNGGWGVEDPAMHTGHMADVGRWPANLILDADAGAMVDAQSGKVGCTGGGGRASPHNSYSGGWGSRDVSGKTDTGGASRFFYCPKASKADRDEGVTGVSGVGALRDGGRKSEPRRNTHPTVKPTDLMRYLTRLVTPPGGTILDPFMGSGSTGKAAMLEGFKFIGVELDADYCAIARDRIGKSREDAPLFSGEAQSA